MSYTATPNVTEISSNFTLMLHKTGAFSCTATGKPLIVIHWLKDGSPFNGLYSPGINITYSSTGSNCSDNAPADQCVMSSTVNILNATSTDTGIYTCVAANDYGADITSVYLNIKGTCKCNNKLCHYIQVMQHCKQWL